MKNTPLGKTRAEIRLMIYYSLYYSSLAFLSVGCLVIAADIAFHHNALNYRVILPLNTLLLLMLATVFLKVSPRHKPGGLIALFLLLLLLACQFGGVNLSALLPEPYQDPSLAAMPALQGLYWSVFVLGWLCRLAPKSAVSYAGFVLSQVLLLLICLSVLLADTALSSQFALSNSISTSINSAIFMFFLAVAGLTSLSAGRLSMPQRWTNPVSWLVAALVIATVLLWLSFMHQLAATKQQTFDETASKFEQQLSHSLTEQYGLIRRLAQRLHRSEYPVSAAQLQLEMQSYLRDFPYMDYLAAVDSSGRLQHSLARQDDIMRWFNSYLKSQLAALGTATPPDTEALVTLQHDAVVDHTFIRAVLPQPNPAGLSAIIASVNFNALLQQVLPVIVPPGYQVSLTYVGAEQTAAHSIDPQRRYILESTKRITLLDQLSWQLVLYRDLQTEVSYARQISEVVLLAGWLATLLTLMGQQYQVRNHRQRMRLAANNMRLQHSLEKQSKLQLQHQQIMANSADMICVLDAKGRFIDVSDACRWILGYRPDELVGRPFLDFTHPDDKLFTEHEAEQIIGAGKMVQNFRNRYLCKDGTVVHLMWVANYVSTIGTMYAVARDVNEMVKAEQYQQDQQAVLRMILTEQPLEEIFNRICQMAQAQGATLRASVMLQSAEQLLLVAAPSFSQQYRDVIASLPVAENACSCGTAAYQKSLVRVDDIANDPKWQAVAAAALAEGVKACWSMPMVSLNDDVMGTFALYCTEARSMRKDELELMIICSRFAAVALERSEQKRQLQQSEQRFRSLYELNPEPVYILNPAGQFVDMNKAGCYSTAGRT